MSAPARNHPCPCGSGRKYKQCCLSRQQAPARVPVTTLLQQADGLQRSGRLAEAEGLLRQVLETRAAHPEALHRLGILRHLVGRHEEACTLLEAAVQVDPGNAARHVDLGVMQELLGREDEAIASFRRALSLRPDSPEAQVNMGRALFRRGETAEAVVCYQRALSVRPDFPVAELNLGLALQGLARTEEAVACYRRLLARHPGFPEAHYNLGCVYSELRDDDAAAACYRQALALRPDYADARFNLGVLLQGGGDPAGAAAHFDAALRLRGDSPVVWSTVLLSLLYRGVSADELLSAHRAYAERFEAPLRRQWRAHANERTAERRLRIGYVSPDLRRHSVAYFMEPVLAHHDRAGFEVYAYYCGAKRDDVTARLSGMTDAWVDCQAWSDERLAERIRADRIDILIDLAGHTRDNRLLVFARRPAPVQVSWLGYPATTGLSAMDWRLCSAETDPEGAERWHSERLYRLKSLWCYRPRGDEAPPPGGATPALSRGGEVWFGSMNNLAKVSVETIRAWSRILKAVPDSRLVMTSVPEGEARRRVTERFAAEGIGEDRLLLHGRLPDGEYRQVLDSLDLALDPFPYNGTTTSCETLWRGIPLVSVLGDRSVSRSGYALLKAVGLEELVAADVDGYVALAASLARDPARLTALRSELPERFARSVLRDETGFVRDLESAYRDMWRTWGQTPDGRHQNNRGQTPDVNHQGSDPSLHR